MERFGDHWLTVDGVRVRYWQAGETGTPVVLLHGIGCSVLEWNKNLQFLARDHRVFAVDLPGYGNSDKPGDADYSLEWLGDFVLAFAARLGLGSVHLVGNSLGGRVALECARKEPHKVRSLVLVAPAGVGRRTFINFRLASVPLLGEILTTPSKLGLTLLWRRAFHNERLLEDERVEQKLRDSRQPGAKVAFLSTLRGFLGLGGFRPGPLESLRAALPTLELPVLIVWGRQDRLLPVEQAFELHSSLPDSELLIAEDCGHLPQIEASAMFNDAALGFWRRLEEGR